MKRFSFDLERILSLRRHKEEQWEQKLAVATGRCVRLRREIDTVLRSKAVAFHGRFAAGTSVSVIMSYHLYAARLDQEMQRKQAQLVGFEQEREKIQTKYLEASRDRKILDKLREKREAEYRRRHKLEEVREIDDINTGRAAMSRSRMSVKE